MAGATRYERAAAEIWRHGSRPVADRSALQSELVRYATLAPSSHNTQCWKFRVEDRAVSVLPDFGRRCSVVDPDDHHLFVSLGCATENLIQAALAHGLQATPSFQGAAGGSIRVGLEPRSAVASPLFEAIPSRQCTRGDYDGRALAADELSLLSRAAAGDGVRALLVTEKAKMEAVLEYIVQGNTSQLRDRAFLGELRSWVRFNAGAAVRSGDGLFAGSSGNPSLPSWLGNLMFGLVVTAGGENRKCVRQVRSSAGLAVFFSERDTPEQWVEVGRSYQRFALQATAIGVRTAFMNQPVEVANLRPELTSLLGVRGLRPDLVVRFGRGPAMPPSLRRPLSTVMV